MMEQFNHSCSVDSPHLSLKYETSRMVTLGTPASVVEPGGYFSGLFGA